MILGSLIFWLGISGSAQISSELGTVSAGPDVACARFPATAGAPKTFRVLVLSDHLALKAAVKSKQETPCERLSYSVHEGASYVIQLPKGSPPVLVGIALPSENWSDVSGSKGTAKWRGDVVNFAECTSSEGVHLTAWRGVPLKSERLWHEYVYLGHDVEPTCTEAEWRQ